MFRTRSPFLGGGEGHFTVFVVRNDQSTVVWVVGEVDCDTQDQLAYVAFTLRGVDDIVVDLSRVTFCDLTLVRFIQELRRRHVVTLRDAPALCRELLVVAQTGGRTSDGLRPFIPPVVDLRQSEGRQPVVSS